MSNTAPPASLSAAQWLGFIAMLFGNFMAILDIQIVASSLLDIQAGLAASSNDMAWVQSAYLIAEVVAIPLSGFLSKMLSTRGMFLLSAGGFTLMSLASAFAWNIESMIIFRALQGFFGGGMIPTTMASIFLLFPKEKTMKAQVMVGLVSTLAPVVGPTLGGYLTDLYSWHWLFLINVIPGILICYGVARFVRIDKPDFSMLERLDYLGLLSMALFLGALEYVLEEGPRNNWFDDTAISLSAVASVVGALVFFWRAFTQEHPIVDLSAFKDSNFSLASLFTFCLGVALYGSTFVLPLFLGQVRGYNSMQIGQLMAVSGAVMFFVAPVIGGAARKLPKKYVVAFGTVVLAGSCLVNAHLNQDWGFDQLLVAQLMRGVGLICCFIPLTSLALGTLLPHQVKNASGLFNLMRNLGGAFGLAYLNTELEFRQSYHWQQLIPAVTASRPEAADALANSTYLLSQAGSRAPDTAALASIAQRVHMQALVLTFNDLFVVIAVLALATLLVIPFIKESESESNSSLGGH